jgi:two-component system invasion response regulator UvrY
MVRSAVTGEQGYVSALIVAKSADLREGLHSLLTVTPQIGRISHASNGPSALRQVEEQCPSLVLLDFDLLHENGLNLLRKIKAQCPQVRCLVLTDHAQQQGRILAAGADLVLLKGHPASSLVSTITKLLAIG